VAISTLPNTDSAQFNFGPFFGPVPRSLVRQFRRLLAVGTIAVGLGALALVAYVFTGTLRREVRFGPGWTRMVRLDSFAELVDNRLYIYSHKPFNLLDPTTHRRLASIVQTVGRKATSQTLRYSDDRTAPDVDMVAPGGLRLRRGITLGAVIAVLYVAVRLFASFHGL
jgi:hypothetical protein